MWNSIGLKCSRSVHVIKDVLSRCSLSIANCVGQAYDAAACMSGIHNGVQALMKKEAVNCLYYPLALTHSLNLAISKEWRRGVNYLRNCMEFIFQLVQLIKCSPKRLNLFETVRKEVKFSDGESALSDCTIIYLNSKTWSFFTAVTYLLELFYCHPSLSQWHHHFFMHVNSVRA